ncbi:unnamed protein product, partial [Pleuronectes platessa]
VTGDSLCLSEHAALKAIVHKCENKSDDDSVDVRVIDVRLIPARIPPQDLVNQVGSPERIATEVPLCFCVCACPNPPAHAKADLEMKNDPPLAVHCCISSQL